MKVWFRHQKEVRFHRLRYTAHYVSETHNGSYVRKLRNGYGLDTKTSWFGLGKDCVTNITYVKDTLLVKIVAVWSSSGTKTTWLGFRIDHVA